MVRASDEPDAMYGLAAKSVQISATSCLSFHNASRGEISRWFEADAARRCLFADRAEGKRTSADHRAVRDLVKRRRPMTRRLSSLSPPSARATAALCRRLPIFSQAYYANRPFDESTLDTPLGSGPYKVGKFEVNRYIEYEAGKGLVGCRSSRQPRQLQFRHRALRVLPRPRRRFEGFTGKNTVPRGSRREFWATRYDFPAVKDGRVKRETCRINCRRRTGWFINTRADKFRDPRVREALINAFDFEWTNKTVIMALCAHVSPFQNSDMWRRAAVGGRIETVEPFRGRCRMKCLDSRSAAGL